MSTIREEVQRRLNELGHNNIYYQSKSNYQNCKYDESDNEHVSKIVEEFKVLIEGNSFPEIMPYDHSPEVFKEPETVYIENCFSENSRFEEIFIKFDFVGVNEKLVFFGEINLKSTSGLLTFSFKEENLEDLTHHVKKFLLKHDVLFDDNSKVIFTTGYNNFPNEYKYTFN